MFPSRKIDFFSSFLSFFFLLYRFALLNFSNYIETEDGTKCTFITQLINSNSKKHFIESCIQWFQICVDCIKQRQIRSISRLKHSHSELKENQFHFNNHKLESKIIFQGWYLIVWQI